MKIIKQNFDEISITGTKRWKDKDGKWRQKTRKFYQTINPFNIKNGRQKTGAEILEELSGEMKKWLKATSNSEQS